MLGVSNVFVHPNYQPPQTYHDIAIIQMSKKIKLSKSIMPACLPQAEDDLLKKISEKNFTAAGYGITGVGGKSHCHSCLWCQFNLFASLT